MSDHFLFADDPVNPQEALNERWKILIVDDEPEVHAVTRLALSDFQFLGRGLEFHSAESGAAGCELIRQHPDAAIILLDVVMETDDAGLKVARYIREDLDNHFTRIILRTGQPGQAPERTVIINYDINDYKSKTELTAQKLFTAVMSSLRSYRDIMSIEHSRRGLEKILHASTDLFSEESMGSFLDGLVQQLGWLIGGVRQVLYAEVDPECAAEQYTVRAAFGDEADVVEGRPLKSTLSVEALQQLKAVVAEKRAYFSDNTVLIYCPNPSRPIGGLLCLTGISRSLNDGERDLLQLFAEQIQAAMNNVLREQDNNRFVVELTKRALHTERAQLLDAGHFQHPASKAALILADGVGCGSDEQENIALAAMLLANIAVITKPSFGQETSMVRVCYQRMLRLCASVAPKAQFSGASAAIIALLHSACEMRFERFDGEGFPGLVSAEQFPLGQQILAVVAIVYAELASGKSALSTLKALVAEADGRFAPQLLDTMRNQLQALQQCFQLAE